MKPVTPELSTECAGEHCCSQCSVEHWIDLGEFSECRGSLHHAEQGNFNITTMSTVKEVRYARMKIPNHS